MGLLRSCFADADVAAGGKYLNALVSDLPSRNGWSVAEHAGDRSPARAQRLLSRASWDERAAMSLVRRYAAAGLDDAARRSRRSGWRWRAGRDRPGEAGVVDVGCEATVHGVRGPRRERDQHGALVLCAGEDGPRAGRGAPGIPAEDIADPVRSLLAGLPLDLRFRTKGQLAADILGDAYADGLAFDFVRGDEVLRLLHGPAGVPGRPRPGLRAARRLQLHAHARRRGEDDLRGGGEQAADGEECLGGPLGRPGLEGRAVVRLGLAGHRLPAAQPAHPPLPQDR